MHHRPLILRCAALALLVASTLTACGCGGRTITTMTVSIDLDGVWLFRTDPDQRGVAERWFADDATRAEWDSVKVPGLWDDYGHDAYDGAAWYVRSFDLPADASDAEVPSQYAVVFDGVDDNAEVWLNGVRLGVHTGHAQAFFFDITPHVRPRGNVLAVRIEDTGGPGGMLASVRVRSYDTQDDLLRSAYHDLQPVSSPEWVHDAVIYEVYLRSFSPEGSFAALERRLPELKELGVTVVWLMPVHPVGVAKRKGSLGSPYAVRDFHAVNPEFGTMDDFRSLVAATHAEGMRIIIDLVANHTAWDNPLITEHPDWYTRDAKGRIIAPNPDWSDVADLDYSKSDLRAWMIDMMAWWVRDVGIDGFRCDVAEMVPNDFWVEAVRELRRIKPILMLAEGAHPALHIDAFDMTYAWNTYDLLGPVLRGERTPTVLDEVLRTEQLTYPVGALRLRFSTNHDKHFYDGAPVDLFGVAGAKAAAVLMHTLPGVPLIYNGQEVGSRVPMSLFEKQPIDWGVDSADFRSLYMKLNALRREHVSLRRGTYARVAAAEQPSLQIFTRSTAREEALVVVNLGASAEGFELRQSSFGAFGHVFGAGTMRTTSGGVRFDVPAFGAWVGVRKK
jgi:glycosidase